MNGLRVLPFALFLCWSVGQVASQCGQLPWNDGDYDCSLAPGTVEAYREQRASDGKQRGFCCPPGSGSYERLRKKARQCGVTDCTASNSPPTKLCPTRFIDDEQIDFEELQRDTCTTDSGESGYIAQCCVYNSTEGLLLTTMGAEPNEFPHMAGLSMGCGGTVYNKRYILTASHCVVDGKTYETKSAKGITVTLGTNIGGQGDYKSKAHVYNVEEVIPHEQYSKLKGHPELSKPSHKVTYNDVALLKLDRDIIFGPHVKSLEIAPAGFQPLDYADNAVIAGWGTTDTLELSEHLQKADFVIRSDYSCFVQKSPTMAGPWWYQGKGRQDQFLCVGGVLQGIWSPTAGGGDSGGPAICRGPNGNAVLCGVTSFGGDDEACAAGKDEENCQPSVYAEVSHFRDWIEGHAGPQDPETFHQVKLYGGEVAPGKYEHQVHITSKTGKPCGGTLVSQNTVITAAQCVLKADGSGATHDGLQVVSGLRDLKGSGKKHKIASVGAIPGFKRVGNPVDPSKQGVPGEYSRIIMTDNFYKRDLAVVKLAEKVTIPTDKLAVLPTAKADPTGTATELAFPRNTTYGSTLRQREFNFIDRVSCQKRMNRMKRLGLDVKVDEDILCGAEIYSGGSLCDRELGGGLICKEDDGKDVLCGVQVFRLCTWSVPNGFIDVGRYSRSLKPMI